MCPESHTLSKKQQDLHANIWRKIHSWTCCRPSSGHWYAVYSRCAFIHVTESARTTPWGGLESGQHFRRWSTFDTALVYGDCRDKRPCTVFPRQRPLAKRTYSSADDQQALHRRRCLTPAARRRYFDQRVAAPSARRPTRRQPRRLPSHSAPTPHDRAPSNPDPHPMINVPTKNSLLFRQPLHPATPMLRQGPPPPQSGRPRARERPQPLELPRDPRRHNPPFERMNGKRSLRPLKPSFRQVTKTYASVITSAPINPPSRPQTHHTCPQVPF